VTSEYLFSSQVHISMRYFLFALYFRLNSVGWSFCLNSTFLLFTIVIDCVLLSIYVDCVWENGSSPSFIAMLRTLYSYLI